MSAEKIAERYVCKGISSDEVEVTRITRKTVKPCEVKLTAPVQDLFPCEKITHIFGVVGATFYARDRSGLWYTVDLARQSKAPIAGNPLSMSGAVIHEAFGAYGSVEDVETALWLNREVVS